MINRKAFNLITIFLLIFNVHSLAQVGSPFIIMELGKGIQFTSVDSSFSMAISGRIQSVFEAKSDITNETTGADFLLRRCRMNTR